MVLLSKPFSVISLIVLLSGTAVYAKDLNGFNLDNALIPETQIFSGGPEKDGIPSIDKPKFVKSRDASFMKAGDRVLGIEIDGISKAYPIKILNWHEIVNDSIGEVSFVITYCPLCGSGMAFSREVNGQALDFGVSGLLYNSDVLLYDRESESLWSQLLSTAVAGKYKGTELVVLPIVHTTWADWKRYHPSSLVLSKNTGYWRAYSRNPYGGYEKSKHLYFPVFNKAPIQFHPKERVLGINIGSVYKAYPFIELNKKDQNKFVDNVNGKMINIYWNEKSQSGHITDDEGIVIPVVQSYWFAWYAFHPETETFTAVTNN